MANSNRDRLIQTFLSRNRRKAPGGYRPQKQGTVRPSKPAKRNRPPSY
jgi:hypothetical protein